MYLSGFLLIVLFFSTNFCRLHPNILTKVTTTENKPIQISGQSYVDMVTKTDNIISDDQGNVEVIEHVDKHVIVDQKGNEVDKYEENTTEIPETDQKVPIFVDVPGKNKDENLLFIEAVSEDESQSIENNEEDWWGLSLPLALLGASGLAICYMVYTKSKTINYRLLSKDADALV